MEKVKKRNSIITNATAVASFVITYVLCAVFGWLDVIKGLFAPDGDNVGEVLKMPPTYTVVCFLFLAVLCALAVFGLKLKNKPMVLIAAAYELLFILSFVFLGTFASGGITNQTLYDMIMYFMTAVLLPIYGVIWSINLWFFVIFIPLVVLTVVAVVKAFKKK